MGENYEDCPDKSKLVWDSENCRLDEMCDKLVECKDKITDIINNHPGCLTSYWWIYPSCWSSDYKEFRGIGTTLARKFQGDYRRMCKSLFCVGCD